MTTEWQWRTQHGAYNETGNTEKRRTKICRRYSGYRAVRKTWGWWREKKG